MTDTDIIESLHKIMCSSTTTAADARVPNNEYFKRRVGGFKPEIEFENLVSKYPNIKFLEGGQLIFKTLTGEADSRNTFIYTTISYDDPDIYSNIYKLVEKWKEVEEMYFLQITDDWSSDEIEVKDSPKSSKRNEKILAPGIIFWQYNKSTGTFSKCETQDFSCILNKFNTSERSPNVFPLRSRDKFEYFREFSPEILRKIYANRYFLDVVLRRAVGRKIIDFDGFLEYPKGISLVEIKEKSPIKDIDDPSDESEWRYGWDTRRLLWYLYFSHKTELPVIYNIRHIADRDSRTLVQWDSVSLDDFLTGSDWSKGRGGGGGEDTTLAPYLFFKRTENVLKNLNQR